MKFSEIKVQAMEFWEILVQVKQFWETEVHLMKLGEWSLIGNRILRK